MEEIHMTDKPYGWFRDGMPRTLGVPQNDNFAAKRLEPAANRPAGPRDKIVQAEDEQLPDS